MNYKSKIIRKLLFYTVILIACYLIVSLKLEKNILFEYPNILFHSISIIHLLL